MSREWQESRTGLVFRSAVIVIILSLLIISCSGNDEEENPPSYTLQKGDTVIVITPQAVAVANGSFSVDAYLLREHQIAFFPEYQHSGRYGGGLAQWKGLGWATRSTFLTTPYSHDVLIPDLAEFYYMIGTFPRQFGYGWNDTFRPDADLFDAGAHIWIPADSTLARDNPGTIAFDGESRRLDLYRSLWQFNP